MEKEVNCSRKSLMIRFLGVLGLWGVYALYLWWMFNTQKHAYSSFMAFPLAVAGLLIVRGVIILIKIIPKLFGKNKITS